VLSVRSTPKRRELGNIFVDALTRGGKGLLAISQLLTWPHSVVVVDIKGELYEATAEGIAKRWGLSMSLILKALGTGLTLCMGGILRDNSTPVLNICCIRQGSVIPFSLSGRYGW
jgi:hypothetical protein